LGGWEEYLNYLEKGPHSVQIISSDLSPKSVASSRKGVEIPEPEYSLWPFQKDILDEIGDSTLILGLPTGLGKTYVAGAKLHRESRKRAVRVIFLVPSIPLGVQQTLFVREKLGAPQTFYNDNLAHYERILREARGLEDPIGYLAPLIDGFPFDIVVADECQRYIGETDGYSILLSAKASCTEILALSATPQLHAPERLEELRKVFDEIKVFGVEDPGIREHIPERLLIIEEIETPPKLMRVYRALGGLIRNYYYRIRKMYGSRHRPNCTRHPLCRGLLAVKMLRLRMVEDGASSVENYGTWRFRDLKTKRKSLDGETIYNAYRDALSECRNHKLDAAIRILNREVYRKAIVYIESVDAAKELAVRLQKDSVGRVACIVGKGDMTMDHQASALLQFREEAQILVCTSVGEEGLDIPVADIEVWVDPPNNPRKWIQRFGRILRQPGDKRLARIYAPVSKSTHEKARLHSVKKKVEKTYRFSQKLKERKGEFLPEDQKTIAEFMR